MVFNLCSCQFLQSLVPSRMADAEVPGQLRSAELWLSCLARGRAAILDLPGVHLPRKLLRTRNRWQSVAKSVAIRVRVCACKTSMDFNKGLPYQKCCDSHSTRKKQTPIIWASLKHISAKIGRHKRACIQGGRDWHVVEDHEHVWTEHHNEAATQPRKRDWIESSALQNPMSNKEGLNRIVKAEIMGNHGEIMGKSWGNHGSGRRGCQFMAVLQFVRHVAQLRRIYALEAFTQLADADPCVWPPAALGNWSAIDVPCDWSWQAVDRL